MLSDGFIKLEKQLCDGNITQQEFIELFNEYHRKNTKEKEKNMYSKYDKEYEKYVRLFDENKITPEDFVTKYNEILEKETAVHREPIVPREFV